MSLVLETSGALASVLIGTQILSARAEAPAVAETDAQHEVFVLQVPVQIARS